MLAFPATSYRPDAFFAAAARLGIELVALTDLPAAAARFGCRVVAVDFERGAVPPADLPEVDGVIAVDERSAVAAAQVAARGRSRRPYHSLAGVQAALDKGEMRRRLAEEHVPAPRVVARLARGAPLPRVSFPCVVKPPQLTGSQGVIRADDARSLGRAVAHVRSILHRHPRATAADEPFFELVVEEYVDGPEVAVEGLMVRGELLLLAVFDKPEPLTGPYFEETAYVTPSVHGEAVVAACCEVTERAARALGLTEGPVHAELRLTAEGPRVIEIAARSIGGLCSRALLHVIGSLEEWLLCHAVGLALPARPESSKASGVLMVPVPASGVVRAIAGVEQARAIAGVDAVSMSVGPGAIVRAAPDGASYLGFVFAHADEPETVADILRAVARHLRVTVQPLLPVLD